jgi:ABC-type phosphate transport system substrate-binding protein
VSWRRAIATMGLLLALASSRAHAGWVVVRNAKNPTAKLTKDGIKAVFRGKTKTWSNGEDVVLVIGSEDSPAMRWLAESVYGVSTKTFLAKLKQDVFKGDVTRPLSAEDDAKTLKRVASGAGVIGVVSDAAARALPAGVVVVAIE